MRKILLICLSFIAVRSFAQSCVSSFTATSGKSDITLNWTVNSNCSCPQVTIYWATDSLFSNPTIVYSGTDNSFDHTTPDMSNTNYYRLIDCNGQPSQIIAIRVGGLNYLFYPNPVSSSSGFMANIVFQNPYNNYYNLFIFDHNGQLVRKTALFAGTTCQFSSEGLPAGLYLFVIASALSNVAAAGKFYVAYN